MTTSEKTISYESLFVLAERLGYNDNPLDAIIEIVDDYFYRNGRKWNKRDLEAYIRTDLYTLSSSGESKLGNFTIGEGTLESHRVKLADDILFERFMKGEFDDFDIEFKEWFRERKALTHEEIVIKACDRRTWETYLPYKVAYLRILRKLFEKENVIEILRNGQDVLVDE